MIKFFRKIHLWLSVPFGIFVTLICFSGAMLIFEPEITRSIQSDVYYVESVKEAPVQMAELLESVKCTLPDSVSITGVTVFKDPERTYQVNLSKPRRASVFVDQYTGQITGRYERIGFFSTMFKLHRWLLDGSNPHGDGVKVGKLLVGISTLIFAIALITGVIIWWPRARRNFKKNITIPFSQGWRGFWKGLHVAGGMYALIFVLAMALTGLTWSFDWYRSAFYAVCGVEHTPRNFARNIAEAKVEGRGRGEGRGHGHRHGGREGDKRHHSEFGNWQKMYDELRAQNPDAPEITVSPERKAEKSEADNLRSLIYSIHTGSIGGIWTRILWFLGALLGASLPLTGYYIWIKSLFHKKS